MDFLNHNYLNARSPYDYTFNFWNDYLGLTTLVTKNNHHHKLPQNPNSITESLKATLGLEDEYYDDASDDMHSSSSTSASSSSSSSSSPPVVVPCPCALESSDHHHQLLLDCCSCSCAPHHHPSSILDLKERFSILSPFQKHNIIPPSNIMMGADGMSCFGNCGAFQQGFDLFSVEASRKMRNSSRGGNNSTGTGTGGAGARGGGGGGKQEPKICVFCRNNGAPEEVYGSHVLKTPDGRVVCPILRAYTCPLCSANGDNAHTIKYCPLSKEQPGQRALKGGRAVGGKRVKIF